MALFGAPLAHEDHAVRACYAALAMQEALQRYAEEIRRTQGLLVQMRVGLNSGEVVVRAIGNDLHMDYSAIGQTTHLAARMEQLAAPGSILLTAATLRLVEGLVRVQGPARCRPKAWWSRWRCSSWSASQPCGGAYRRQWPGAVALVGRQSRSRRCSNPDACQDGPGTGGRAAGRARRGQIAPGLRVSPVAPHAGLVAAGEQLRVLRQGHRLPPVRDLLKAYCHIEDRDDLRTVRLRSPAPLTLDDALQDTIPAVLALFEAPSADNAPS